MKTTRLVELTDASAHGLMPTQKSMLPAYLKTIYAEGGMAPSDAVINRLTEEFTVPQELIRKTKRRKNYNPWRQRVRYVHQNARRQGLSETADRGMWELTKAGYRTGKTTATSRKVVLVFRTGLGSSYLADSMDLLRDMPEDSLDLIVTSPPYPLLRPRRKGGSYVSGIKESMWPTWFGPFADESLRVLKPTGSLVVNVGNAWVSESPEMSTYHHRMVLDLTDRAGFHLCQEAVWHNTCRIPGPTTWALKDKIRLKDQYEHVFWFGKTARVKADTRNFMLEATPRWKRLVGAGGAFKDTSSPSSHERNTKDISMYEHGGVLPGNLIHAAGGGFPSWLRAAMERGFTHPARFPEAIPEMFIEICTEPGDMVGDFFAGAGTTAQVCERLGRRWTACDCVPEFLQMQKLGMEHMGLKVEAIG